MKIAQIGTLLLVTSGLLLLSLPVARANDPAAADAKFKAMDTDGDGRISRAEHVAGAKAMFEQMDTNKDGIVTAAEMDAAHPMKSDKPAGAQMSASEKIKTIDTDADGQLTTVEHAAGSETMFNRMDTNGDGYLSQGEMTAGHKSMMKKGE